MEKGKRKIFNRKDLQSWDFGNLKLRLADG